ncbi:MAG: hypothetical protein R3220_08675 [Balneolaceae bacterium]|nr:hypothetical protein [Balneolaceae bacterium]
MNSQPTSIKEKIHDFVDGNLSNSEVDELWAELIGRPDDLDYLQTLATLKKMGNEGKFDHLYDTEPNVIPLSAAGNRSSTFYERLKPFLVAATVLIIGFAILFNLETTVQQPQSVEPISMIEYEVERSVDNQTILDNYLQEAVSLATNGNLEAAFSQLNQASSLNLTTDQAIDLKMVRGAIQYNSQHYSDALETFREIKQIEEIDRLNLEKSTWYLANTQLQMGMIDEARVSMEEVINLDGSFSRVAKQKLENLTNPNS